MEIRRAVPQDLENIKKLHDDSLPVKYPITFYETVVRGAIDNFVATVRTQDNNEEIIGVITSQTKTPSLSEVCAILSALTCKKPHDNDGFSWSVFGMEEELLCYITTLCISTSTRRQGIGSKLLQALIDKCMKNERCTMIYLHVHVDNQEAIAFYERHGFQRVRLLPFFYDINNRYENAYLYVRKLRPAKTMRYAVQQQAKAAWAFLANTFGWEHA